MVSAKASSGLLYHYFYTDEQNFGVAITGDSRILMVRDDDLDGKIDHYGAGTPTVPPREAKVSESDSFYPEGQRVYLDLMAATPHIVPQEVRDALSKAGTI